MIFNVKDKGLSGKRSHNVNRSVRELLYQMYVFSSGDVTHTFL